MLRRWVVYFAIAFLFVGTPLTVERITTPAPTTRTVHIEAFRYGTSPAVIRANRGDRLTLTFSTRDTAHSFFLQDYRVDAKITPTREAVEVFDPLRVNEPPYATSVLHLTAGSSGFWGSLSSVSRFRCHVYCGPMHGFEQGDLVVRPNYLLWGSLGLLASLISTGLLRVSEGADETAAKGARHPVDLAKPASWMAKWLSWRPLQFGATMPVLAGFTLVVLAGLVGTKVGGRNAAVMMTWAVWMSFLAIVLVPLGTRLWCFVCPLPIMGEILQRGALTEVRPAVRHGRYGNRFFSLGFRWPRALRGSWLRLFFFVGVGTLSASLAGQPRWTAYLLLSLAVLALLMALVWELRAFCRYLCPVAAFISLYSRLGRLMVRVRDHTLCRSCRGKPCLRGNGSGWACSFGLYVPRITGNADCGVCTECFKSCPHDNVSLWWRRGVWSGGFSSYGEAWQAVVMLALAMAYSLTIHSPWPAVRDMANVVDKANWKEFGLYAGSVAALSLGVVPLLYWLAVGGGARLARRAKRGASGWEPVSESRTGELFKRTMPALIPLGLGMWVAFLIPVFLSNFTFILATVSDPFGWGWNLFGTAGMPWVQVWPSGIPWLQAAAILVGVGSSLRQGYHLWREEGTGATSVLCGFAPTAGLFCLQAAGMLVYFTHF